MDPRRTRSARSLVAVRTAMAIVAVVAIAAVILAFARPFADSLTFEVPAAAILTLMLLAAVLHRWALERAAADHRRQLSLGLDQIISSVPGVVWETWQQPDAANHRSDFVSEHVSKMLGYSVEEWLSTPNFWQSIVHPDDREQSVRNAAEHFARGGLGSNEFRWIRKDGSAIWALSQAMVIVDESGMPVGMRGVTLDITARKRAEEGLNLLSRLSEGISATTEYEESVALAARIVLPALGDACIIDLLEEDGSVTRAAACHADPLKQPLLDRLRQFPPDRSRSFALQLLKNGESALMNNVTPEHVARHSPTAEAARLASEIGFGSFICVPLVARGKSVGVMTVSSEHRNRYDDNDLALARLVAHRVALAIDNRRLYRASLRESQAKDDLLATISHELRTPMTAVLGWVRLLKMGELEPQVVLQALEAIDHATQAQSRILDDLFDVSAVIRGKLRLEIGPVDLAGVIQTAIEAVQPAATAREIALSVDPRDWSGTLHGDANRLRQVVWNLLSNAVKFSRPHGEVAIEVCRGENDARIEVRDSGRGIRPEVLPYIFEPFRQGTRPEGGLGLGLAIVRQIVELHGGRVRAKSDGIDRGATFIVELPLVADAGVRPPVREAIKPPGFA